MNDLKIFRISGQTVTEAQSQPLSKEKDLQKIIEQNLDTFLGVRFLKSEFSTGQDHGGRMDTIGLDENNCPVIIEYKRSSSENVINQALFYFDWLMTHRGDFEMVVLGSFDEKTAQSVEWSSPRAICIASDFNKYDIHAIKQIPRNIELIRYINFEDDLLLLEQVSAASAPVKPTETMGQSKEPAKKSKGRTTVSEALAKADKDLKDLYEELGDHLNNFGDDVSHQVLSYYIAFRRIRNFACVEVKTQEKKLTVNVRINPDNFTFEEGFTRDVRSIGHHGTGDLEITIRNSDDIEKALPLLKRSYEGV